MATQSLSLTNITKTGLDLTDASNYQTMTTGSGNGSVFDYNKASLIFLRNTTGGSAVYTIKTDQGADYSDRSITIPDLTVTVPTTETWVVPVSAIYGRSSITVECDVAGLIMVTTKFNTN